MLPSQIMLLLIILFFINFHVVTDQSAQIVHTIIIKEMKFQPAEITVQKGDIIVWINKDIVAHNVTEEKTNGWKSSTISDGKSWKMIVKTSSSYFCSLHPIMKGKISLKKKLLK